MSFSDFLEIFPKLRYLDEVLFFVNRKQTQANIFHHFEKGNKHKFISYRDFFSKYAIFFGQDAFLKIHFLF